MIMPSGVRQRTKLALGIAARRRGDPTDLG
jgi:hypothetical protein